MPLPVNPDRVPPLTAISVLVNVVDASDRVKVMAAVWPIPSVATLLVMVIVGAVVSGTIVLTLMLTVLSASAPSVLAFAAASVNTPLATLMTAGAVLLGAGVNRAL